MKAGCPEGSLIANPGVTQYTQNTLQRLTSFQTLTWFSPIDFVSQRKGKDGGFEIFKCFSSHVNQASNFVVWFVACHPISPQAGRSNRL